MRFNFRQAKRNRQNQTRLSASGTLRTFKFQKGSVENFCIIQKLGLLLAVAISRCAGAIAGLLTDRVWEPDFIESCKVEITSGIRRAPGRLCVNARLNRSIRLTFISRTSFQTRSRARGLWSMRSLGLSALPGWCPKRVGPTQGGVQ